MPSTPLAYSQLCGSHVPVIRYRSQPSTWWLRSAVQMTAHAVFCASFSLPVSSTARAAGIIMSTR
jgi:hypothetical protein